MFTSPRGFTTTTDDQRLSGEEVVLGIRVCGVLESGLGDLGEHLIVLRGLRSTDNLEVGAYLVT